MIKNTNAITILVLSLSTGSSFSSPLPLEPLSKWTGLYAGLNAGGMWSGHTKTNLLSSFVPGSQNVLFPDGGTYTGVQSALGASGIIPTSNSGFIGGAQIGYNLQFTNRWMGGFEADFQGVRSGHNNRQTSTTVPLLGTFPDGVVYSPGKFFKSSLSNSMHIDYFGTLRTRLGWITTPKLIVHGTGGLAYGGVSSATSVTQINNDRINAIPANALIPITFNYGRYSNTRFGWTAGADAEWMFMTHWSAKIEYLYYDLGHVSYELSPTLLIVPILPGPMAVVTSQASTRFNGNIIRVGVNYHFSL